MKIAVLGAGAMGTLFGGILSQQNDVRLVEINPERVNRLNECGAIVCEEDGEHAYFPKAVTDSKELGTMDLVLVFVKAMFTECALEANRSLIGKDTYLMTLQNGAGHEEKLLKFADRKHVIIGTTQHNASLTKEGLVFHGGKGITTIGLLDGHSEVLEPIKEAFNHAGLKCVICDEVKKQIWTKLFTNTGASALTAVLQVPLGYLVQEEHAHEIMKMLCREAVTVANAEGDYGFIEDEVIQCVETVCKNAPNGYTSIYSDIKAGRHTEVDTISGSVIAAAEKAGVEVPYHKMMVNLIHAMEQRPKIQE